MLYLMPANLVLRLLSFHYHSTISEDSTAPLIAVPLGRKMLAQCTELELFIRNSLDVAFVPTE
jgi:hypothetical protein